MIMSVALAVLVKVYIVRCVVLNILFPVFLFPAHSNMKPASLLTSVGSLTNASINRSPYAYEQNPDKDKCVCVYVCVCVCVCACMHVCVLAECSIFTIHCSYNANVDHTMFVLKMIDDNKKPLGMIRYMCTLNCCWLNFIISCIVQLVCSTLYQHEQYQ